MADRSSNHSRRAKERSIYRRRKRLRERRMVPFEQMEPVDQLAISELQLNYGTGPFLAADAVVESADGYILVIRRKDSPGEGLPALPGGKMDEGETFFKTAVRELHEETGLRWIGKHGEINEFTDVDLALLLENSAVFDDPHRDPRGRWITVAHHFKLKQKITQLVIEAGDDAAEAEWLAKRDFKKWADDQFFADHLEIVRTFV